MEVVSERKVASMDPGENNLNFVFFAGA